jgi:HEPN domain-containing protein
MTGQEESSYRLRVATTLSNKADAAFGRGEWREAALFARAAIENAAKAVLGAFASVPRSQEPRDILSEAVKLPGFPAGRRTEAQRLAENKQDRGRGRRRRGARNCPARPLRVYSGSACTPRTHTPIW